MRGARGGVHPGSTRPRLDARLRKAKATAASEADGSVAGAGQRAWAASRKWTPLLLVRVVSLVGYAAILGNELVSDTKLLIAENPGLLSSREWLPWFIRDY